MVRLRWFCRAQGRGRGRSGQRGWTGVGWWGRWSCSRREGAEGGCVFLCWGLPYLVPWVRCMQLCQRFRPLPLLPLLRAGV